MRYARYAGIFSCIESASRLNLQFLFKQDYLLIGML